MAHATTSNLQPQDYFTTTLSSNVAATDTTISLNAVPTASEGYLVIDPNNPSTREIVYYNSSTSSTVSLPDNTAGSSRGLGGTSVQAHTSGTLVEQRAVAEYWLALQNGESMAVGSVNATLIAVNGVQAQNFATNAIALGYAAITTNAPTTSLSPVQVGAGGATLSATVTIPAGGRRVKITAWSYAILNNTNGDGTNISIWDGTVGSGTELASSDMYQPAASQMQWPATVMAIVQPAAGTKTYNVGVNAVTGGTSTMGATPTAPAFILVEAI